MSCGREVCLFADTLGSPGNRAVGSPPADDRRGGFDTPRPRRVRWVAAALLAVVLFGCSDRAAPRATPPNPAPSGSTPAAPRGLFTDITQATGITFAHCNGATGRCLYPETMGAGVALFDFDNDGLLDIYFVNGNHLAEPADPKITNVLYRNNGDGTFTDVTAAAGVGDSGYGQGCCTGDFDNDGDIDLYVTNLGADRLYRNDGNGKFTDVTRSAGIDNPGLGQACAFLDFDGDGWLDIYVQNYLSYDLAAELRAMRNDYDSPLAFRGAADLLYRNNRDGTFREVSKAAGTHKAAGRGMGLAAVDFDGDGHPDVFVANDAMENYYFANRGDGTFVDRSVLSGLAYDADGVSESTMGVDVGDIDGDGRIDVVSPVLRTQGCALYLNRGKYFEEASKATRVHALTLPYTGFSPNLFDADNDGDLDLLVCNGEVERQKPATKQSPYSEQYGVPDLLLRNDGKGRFDAFPNPGAHFARKLCGRGSAVGDLDNDGDLDVVINNLNGRPVVLRNEGTANGWITLRLEPKRGDRDAIGTRVELHAGGRRQVAVVHGAVAYCSVSDRRPHFGIGTAPRIDRIEVHWPRRGTTTLTDVAPGKILTVREE
ncbi:MAG: CRTAC1 family protein [Planctomycetes bacterium]|nr:CRTAC1 family protein [Planctomycetota bacterium]